MAAAVASGPLAQVAPFDSTAGTATDAAFTRSRPAGPPTEPAGRASGPFADAACALAARHGTADDTLREAVSGQQVF